MHKFLMFGPLFFVIGTYTFTRFSDYYIVSFSIPNFIALGIAIAFIFAEIIISIGKTSSFSKLKFPNIYFQEYAYTIINDYEMVNPSTSDIGYLIIDDKY